MSWMSEKKARELLKEYMQAELLGEDQKAEEIEEQLKKAGWKITIGPDGTDIRKEEKENQGLLGDWFLPKESTLIPYSGDNSKQGSNNKNLWLTIGISVGLIGLIILTIFIAKRIKNAGAKTI